MKAILIEVQPIRDGEVVTATIVVEGKKWGKWTKVKDYTVQSGTAGAKRRLLLEDDERLIVEGASTFELVYDPEQMAVVPRLKK